MLGSLGVVVRLTPRGGTSVPVRLGVIGAPRSFRPLCYSDLFADPGILKIASFPSRLFFREGFVLPGLGVAHSPIAMPEPLPAPSGVPVAAAKQPVQDPRASCCGGHCQPPLCSSHRNKSPGKREEQGSRSAPSTYHIPTVALGITTISAVVDRFGADRLRPLPLLSGQPAPGRSRPFPIWAERSVDDRDGLEPLEGVIERLVDGCLLRPPERLRDGALVTVCPSLGCRRSTGDVCVEPDWAFADHAALLGLSLIMLRSLGFR